MEKKCGLSWMHRKFRCWTAIFLVLGTLTFTYGTNDICEQQEQSSFQLKRLAPSSRSKQQCSELCCKESSCSIPLLVRRHCYGISCAKKELCQVVFEQLKEFQGHRVDKRDAEEDDQENGSGRWENDQGKALNIYQNRTSLNIGDDGLSLHEKDEGPIVQGFPAFLISRAKRGIQEEENMLSVHNQSLFSQNQTNKFFISLNNSTDDTDNISKRSSDEEDDIDDTGDDVDSDNDGEDNNDNSCSSDSKFHQSVIPRRKKNYHFKRLERRSNSLKACSKRCCKTDSCILSFMLENSCIGVLCNGDGNCHTKRDGLPQTNFELSIIKREAETEDGSSENDEQKRSTAQATNEDNDDGDDDDDDGGDGDGDDVDGEIENDEEEEKQPKHEKHTKHHKHKRKSKKSRKPRRKASNRTKKSHNSRRAKHGHKHHKSRRNRHYSQNVKTAEESDGESDDTASGDSEVAGKNDEIKKHGESDDENVISDRYGKRYRNHDAERYEFKYDENRRKYPNDEYSDDLRHLIQYKKPVNSTLFDDTIVGTETESTDQDRESPVNEGRENPFIRPNEAVRPFDNDYEAGRLHKENLEEEQAGMADESMKMRMSSVENDKRSDLMIAHRHYEDTGGASDVRNEEGAIEEDRMRLNGHYRAGENNYREYHEGGRKHGYYKEHPRNNEIKEYKHRHGHDEYEASRNEVGEMYKPRWKEATDRRMHAEEKEKIAGEGEASGSGEDLEIHHAPKKYASKMLDNHHSKHSHSGSAGKKVKSRKKGSSATHRKYHKHSGKKGSRKKSLGVNKEEKLIEKLEHLEEKMEKKQKSDIESRNEKILQKVETLASKLEGKTPGDKKEKSGKKENLDRKSKSKTEKRKGMKGGGVQSQRKTMTDEKITSVLESSGDLASPAENSSPEQITIPQQIHHHKKSSNSKPSKTKHHHEEKPHADKEHIAESSGAGSASRILEDSKAKIHLESSGSGEDDNGEVAHYLTYERDHKVEDTNWPSTQLVVPYNERKSHTGHHGSHKMPILNENMAIGLSKVKYDKKDKIAKPLISDKNKFKSHTKKGKDKAKITHSRQSIKKSHIESKHKTEKAHWKSKHKTKESKKATENVKLMKEFEKYKAFVKAQELAISGDGSGDQGSGTAVHAKMKKASDKKRSKRRKKKHQTKKNKKDDKHKKAKRKENKSKNSSAKSTARKHFEELVSSGFSYDHGSGDGNARTYHKEERKSKEVKGDGKKKEKSKDKQSEDKQHHQAEKSSELGADKKSGAYTKSVSLGPASTTNQTAVISKGNGSRGIDHQTKRNHSVIDERPKLFHDRKETTADSDNTDQKRKPLEGSAKSLPVSGLVPKPKITGKGGKQGEVISERNTSWPHPKGVSSSHESPKSLKPMPTLHSNSNSIIERNKTVPVQEPSKKRLDTTHRIIKNTERLKTKPTTTPFTTTIRTTPKSTTAATTVAKKKPKKVNTKPRRKITTTSIPTLSILTGDEDVEPAVRPTEHKLKLTKNTHASKKTKAKKPTSPKKKLDIEEGKIHVKGSKVQGESPVENEPIANGKPYLPQPQLQPPQVQTIIGHRPAQLQLPGKGGSAGVLGDLQLPEPPGNGNRASGPLFYGQQGVPANIPMQQPLGQIQYHNAPIEDSPGMDPSQLANGGMHDQGSVMGGPQTVIGDVPEVVKRPFNPTVKTIPATQYFGYTPMEKPTAIPMISIHGNGLKPHDNTPQSPENTIQRILGVPHKQSPLNVIQNILKPKNAPHKGNQGVVKSLPTKQLGQNKGSIGPGKNAQGQNVKGKSIKAQTTKGQYVKDQKPSEKKGPLPSQVKKKPSPTGKKPLNPAKPLKTGQKPPLGRLNDFFKKANTAVPIKTTVPPQKAKVQKPAIPQKKVPESSAPVNPKGKKDDACPVRQNLPNMVLSNGRKSGVFTKMQGYPPLEVCIQECCKTPTCDLLFKSGEVCYLVKCHNPNSCKTEPLKEPTMHTRIVYVKKPEPKLQPVKHNTCEGENAFGITWKETKPANFAARSCPREAKGMAKRKCNDHAKWLAPDFSDCVSDEYTNLNENAKHLGFTSSVKDVLSKLEEITTQTIDNSMIFGGDIIKATDILDQITKFAEKNRIERFGFGALRNFARSSSNLLDETNKQEWENVNHSLKGPGKIMDDLEKFGVITAGKIPLTSNNQPIVTNNLIMSVARLPKKAQKYIFPNYSMPYLKKWTTKRDQIILPGQLFLSGPVRVASINYKTLAQLLPHQWSTASHVTFTDGFRVNSKVIATSISPEPKQKISPPVTVILHHLKEINTARTKCVHWDFKSNVQNGGSWSSEGCWVVTSNATVTVCQCEHLTHFAVLMNLSDEDRVSAKEQAKENTFALMWLGIPVLVVLSVGAMYTCFAWSKAPRRRHVVVKDGKPRLPEDDVIVTKTVKEDFPGSPNRYLYSSYTSPSPSDLEWEHVWDFLTNSEFENWQCSDMKKRKKSRRRRLDLRPSRLLRSRKQKLRDKFETSEYFSEGDSTSLRWKNQDDYEWSRERIKCFNKGMIDLSSEASQPVDSLEEFSDDTSVADSKDGDKSSNSFDTFTPDAISSPHSAYGAEPRFYNFVYRSNFNLQEKGRLNFLYNVESRLSLDKRAHYSSCSSIDTLRRAQPSGIQKTKCASTTCLLTIGRKNNARFCNRKYSSRISLAASMKSVTQSVSSGFLDKTWSSKYASSLSISTIARSLSTKTINEDVEGFASCQENTSSEQGYGTFESTSAFSNDVMDMNITSSDIGFDTDSRDASKASLSNNIPTYDMNLLTPSKKATCLSGKPLESSSLDDLRMEDFDKDVHLLEGILDQSSSFDSKRFFDLRNETRELLKQSFVMNMDLLGSDTEPKKAREVIELETENIALQPSRRSSLCIPEVLTRRASAEDMGIDLSLSSAERSSFEDSSTENLRKFRIESSDGFMSTDSETFSSVDTIKPSETSDRSEKVKTRRNGNRSKRVLNIPRASTIKKKTKVTRKRAERVNAVVTGVASRSPTKHMRSYIVLRQQSRYSDHEKQAVSTAQEDLDSASGNDSQYGRKQGRSTAKVLKKRSKIVVKADNEDRSENGDENSEGDRTTEVNATLFIALEQKATSDDRKDIECSLTAKEESQTPARIGKATRSSEPANDDSVDKLTMCEEETTRRNLESSVFGSTLKRWKGRSRLHSSCKQNSAIFAD